MQIGIVVYGASNIFSVLRAISFLGAKAKIVANPEELKSIDKIILPGQGSMGSCINNLKKNDLFESLNAITYPYFHVNKGEFPRPYYLYIFSIFPNHSK